MHDYSKGISQKNLQGELADLLVYDFFIQNFEDNFLANQETK